MTKHKALITIMAAITLTLVGVTWSPLVADARWAAQEEEPLKLPVTSPVAHLDAADAGTCVAIPETFLLSVGSNENDINPVSGKVNVQDIGDAGAPEMHVIWWWCYVTVCKWVYTPDNGWQKVCYEKKQKCYFEHSHPDD